MTKNKKLQSNLLLLLTAIIWGSAFVAQSIAMDNLGTFTFNAARAFIAGFALLPVVFFMSRMRKKRGEAPPEASPGGRRALVVGGVVCGVVLTVASALQQLGIEYDINVGKAGFLTALYIIIVPLAGIFLKKRAHFTLWISVLLALVGMYLLCIKEGLTIETRDLLVVGCAFCYSLHILVIDYFSPKVDCVKMSCIQFFVCGALSLTVALFAEGFTAPTVLLFAWLPILYSGVMSSGVGYTLQMLAQRNTSPAMASLIMSLESVFAALAGWLLLGQGLTPRELVGCVVMFAAILLAQAPDLLSPRKAKASCCDQAE
ncbi:MAG TPA: DMT family transporter [Clostridia bacterium]|nr:DMT family transporter [Clostridia bacterium]